MRFLAAVNPWLAFIRVSLINIRAHYPSKKQKNSITPLKITIMKKKFLIVALLLATVGFCSTGCYCVRCHPGYHHGWYR
jgi:hypothetical protein